MAKVNGRRGRPKKERDQVKVEKMKDAVDGSAPHLPNMPNDRDLKFHFDTVTAWKSKLDEVNGNYRKALQVAEEAGLNTKSLIDAMKKGKKDPYLLRDYFNQMFAHLKHLGLPIQLVIFDTIKGTPDEQAYKQGREVGEGGKTPDNPYPEGSPQHAQYKRGVAHGIGKNLGQTPEAVDKALAEADGEGVGGDKQHWPDDAQIASREGEQPES